MSDFILYEPREDSFLLKACVEKHARGRVLEVGTGSGILARSAASNRNVTSVVGVDIQPGVISYLKKYSRHTKIRYLVSDLFEAFDKRKRKPKFDTIIFNPPYLPTDRRYPDVTLDGGKNGYEVIERFLDEVGSYLAHDGCVLLLFSSLSKKDVVDRIIDRHLLCYEMIARKKFSFEELYVYKIVRSDALLGLEKRRVRDLSFFDRGKRGYIFSGTYKGKKVAVKVVRRDGSKDSTVEDEAYWLGIVNKLGIGPQMHFASKDFVVLDFIEGLHIADFCELARRSEIVRVLKNVFDQVRTLDEHGIMKREMHRPFKHVIVDRKSKKPMLIDFERCRRTERVRNVTQFCQFVTSARFGRVIREKRIAIPNEQIRVLAQAYSKKPTKQAYRMIRSLIS